MRPRVRWRDLESLQPAKMRLKKFQSAYWKYFRPLYCEVISPPEAERVLVLSPHIDDDVVGCGGVLARHALRGAAITSVYLRDGGAAREEEARAAAEMVGIASLEFLRWPEHGVRVNEDTVGCLAGIIDGARPDIAYAPFFLDPHPDHAATASLLAAALKGGSRVGTCFFYEIWMPLVPNALVDITAQAEAKSRAINAHRSQVETIDMSTGMLGLNAYRAKMNRMNGYAEAFLRLPPDEVVRILKDVDG